MANAANSIPSAAKPMPVSIPISGTSSIAGVGGSPKQNATSSGAIP